MTNKIHLTGYIRSCKIQEPYTSFFQDQPKYLLELEPDGNHQHLFNELEWKVKEKKERLSPDVDHLDSYEQPPLFKGCSILFETLNKPTLEHIFFKTGSELLPHFSSKHACKWILIWKLLTLAESRHPHFHLEWEPI